jgi:glutathione S-transferase
VALAEKGVLFKSNHIHLIETGWYQTCSPAFKMVNPGATVPVLVHNGHPVYESHDIIEYIDATFEGTELTPKEVQEQVQLWTGTKGALSGISPEHMKASLASCIPGMTMPCFVTMIHDVGYLKIFWGFLHHPNKERPLLFTVFKTLGKNALRIPGILQMIRTSRDHMQSHLAELEDLLSDGRPFLTGERFTMADVTIVSIFERMKVADFEFLWSDKPNVTKYWSRIQARPSYKIAIVDEELPIMADGVRRLRTWKKESPWLKAALEGNDPVSVLPLMILIISAIVGVMAIGFGTFRMWR